VPSLEQVRKSKYLNLRELAENAAISHGAVTGIEAGRVQPCLYTVRALAEALGVEPGEIAWPDAREVVTE